MTALRKIHFRPDTGRQFDLDWPNGHETMRGFPARIVARDLRGPQPLAVVIMDPRCDRDEVQVYAADGTFDPERGPSSLDLRNREGAL